MSYDWEVPGTTLPSIGMCEVTVTSDAAFVIYILDGDCKGGLLRGPRVRPGGMRFSPERGEKGTRNRASLRITKHLFL